MLSSIDPIVHGALVTLFTYLINYLFAAIGLDLGGDVATGLATVIVGYILSLFGLNLWIRATAKPRGILPDSPEYHPPFTS